MCGVLYDSLDDVWASGMGYASFMDQRGGVWLIGVMYRSMG